MKRMLVSAALVAAAFAPVAPAHAKYCVTDNGRTIVCVAIEDMISPHEPICVTQGGQTLVCV